MVIFTVDAASGSVGGVMKDLMRTAVACALLASGTTIASAQDCYPIGKVWVKNGVTYRCVPKASTVSRLSQTALQSRLRTIPDLLQHRTNKPQRKAEVATDKKPNVAPRNKPKKERTCC